MFMFFNDVSAIADHPLFAAGFAGLGCMRKKTVMSRLNFFFIALALASANFPIPTTVETPSKRITSTKALSQKLLIIIFVSPFISGGVIFLPVSVIYARGQWL